MSFVGSGENERMEAMPIRQINAPIRIAVRMSNQVGTLPR
jgi:hypothetical protein